MITLSGHNVTFRKNWHHDDLFSAECLGFSFDGERVTADMRSTNKHSLGAFMKQQFPQWVAQVKKTPDTTAISISDFYTKYEAEFNERFDRLIDYPRPMYGFQKQTVMTSMNRDTNLLALSMGLGKTVTSLSLSKILEVPRTIIICPSVVKYNWLHEAMDWGYDPMVFSILDAKKSQCRFAYIQEDFAIINFEQVKNFMTYLCERPVGHIVIDEVHFLKSKLSNRHKYIAELYEKTDRPKLTLLSGTPIVNRVDDLYAYLKLSGHALGRNHSFFISRYAIKDGGKITGSKNKSDLKFKLSNFMIRLRSEDCLELPPITIAKYHFKLDDISDEYKNQIAELRDRSMQLTEINYKMSVISGKRGRKSDVDKDEMRQLKQEKFRLKSGMTGNIHTLNRLTSLSKVPKVCEVVDGILAEGKKVVIFNLYKQTIDNLAAHFGKKCTIVDGRINARDKDKHIQRFLHDPTCTVFLGNTKAAGIGINLVNSNDVFFTSFSFTSDQIEQSIKRLHRPGQRKKVNVYFTIAENTIDQRIFDLVSGKLNDINDILDNNKNTTDYATLKDKLIQDLIS